MRCMPRTFTLASLMLGITLFCILCGLAVAFPVASILCVLVAGVSAPPAAVVWLVLARFSKQRGSLLWNVFVGAVVGSIVGLIAGGGGPWGPWWLDYARAIVFSSLGALVWGSVGLLDEFFPTRKAP